jgi:hypothetical protein
MLPFGVTILATAPQGSDIPEGLMNYPVYTSFIEIVLLSTFAKLREATITLVMAVCPYVCPYGTTRFSLDVFS